MADLAGSNCKFLAQRPAKRARNPLETEVSGFADFRESGQKILGPWILKLLRRKISEFDHYVKQMVGC